MIPEQRIAGNADGTTFLKENRAIGAVGMGDIRPNLVTVVAIKAVTGTEPQEPLIVVYDLTHPGVGGLFSRRYGDKYAIGRIADRQSDTSIGEWIFRA
jgi:hypothetical protein